MNCSPPRLLCPWNSPGKSTGVGCHFLLQGIKDRTWVSCIAGFFTSRATREALRVQFSHLVMSDSLWPHGLQHDRPPCLSPTPGVYSNSYPLSWWCHPTTSSSVVPFFSCLQSFPASGSFQMSRFFASGSQILSFSFSISPSNEHSVLISFRMDWLDLLAVQGTLKSLLQKQFKSISSSVLSFLYSPTLTSIHDYWKNYSLD